VSIDSRSILPGQAFFAVVGDRLDGHDFIRQAVEKGASLIVAEKLCPEVPETVEVLLVDSTTKALQRLASHIRKLWNRELLAVTGSMGKTTTRTFVAAVLRSRLPLLESQGNLNNHFGLPLTLLRLEERHQVAVVELGMNHQGEIDALGRICLPTAALLTNVAPVHLEFFNSVDEIAEAKGEILASLDRQGTLFYNSDDPRLRKLASRWDGKQVSYGFEEGAQVRVAEWQVPTLGQTSFLLENGRTRIRGELRATGKHFVYAAAGAAAVGLQHGVEAQEIETALRALVPGRGRGDIRQVGGVLVWDDSYNSNPLAVANLLDTIASVSSRSRTILVLGDMLELGRSSIEYHRRVGEMVPGRADHLVTVGDLAFEMGRRAIQVGFDADCVHHFPGAEEAADFLPRLLREGDLVVVKGSRGVKLDRVIAALEEAR